MSEPINNPSPIPDPAPVPEAPAEKTFTESEVEAIVRKQLAKKMKGMLSAEELEGYRTWKAGQQTEQERWNTLTTERDTARTELTAAQARLEQYDREKFLLGKGVPVEDVEFYAFKIGKLVTDTTSFEKAAMQYIQEHPPAGTMRVDFGAPLGGNQHTPTINETMNSLIRGARK